MAFNYLHDASPDSIASIQNMRIPSQMHAPLLVLVSVVLALLVVAGILTYRLDSVRAMERMAQVRLAHSAAVVARERLERTRVDGLLALDSRLRGIHASGWHVAMRFAALANHLPNHAWVTSIVHASDGTGIVGEAQGVTTLARTMTDLTESKQLHSLKLVRASVQDVANSRKMLLFELHIAEKP